MKMARRDDETGAFVHDQMVIWVFRTKVKDLEIDREEKRGTQFTDRE